MWKEIGEAFNLLGTTGDGCRCILLTGSGKGFCGGIDLTDEKFFSGISPDNIDEDDNDAAATTKRQDAARTSFAFKPQILQMQAAFTAVEQCTVPVVAAIHGACVGAGVDLACCADIRVCSPNATFSVREARLGLAADVGTLQRLPKLVGFGSRVRELCLTGGELVNYTFHLVVVCNIVHMPLYHHHLCQQHPDDFSASDAYRIGFVSRVSESGSDLLHVANEICYKISQNSPVAVAVTKASLNYSRDHSVQEGLEHIALQNSSALMSEDLMKAFLRRGGDLEAQFAPLAAYSRL